MDIKNLFTKRCQSMVMSDIGRLLEITRQPGFISFTAGIPAAELYQTNEIAEAAKQAVLAGGAELLGYNGDCGNLSLRKLLAKRGHDKFATEGTEENILITSGSTQCIDLCTRLFLNPGDAVLTEAPTYVDALDALSFAGAKLFGIDGDVDGPFLAQLKSHLENTPNVKLIYVIPDFQNPSGKCWSLERRREFMEIVSQYNVVVLEDNPYGEITFGQATMPSLQSFDTKGQVLFLSSLSKIFSPGLRCGWILGPTPVIETMHALKEKIDLHTSSLDQEIAYRIMKESAFQDHIEELCINYGQKGQAMMKAMHKFLPNFSFEDPKGGFFLWVQLPKGCSGVEYLKFCLEEKVAFVPGQPFYPNKDNDAFIRMAFPAVRQEVLEEGLQRMATAYGRYEEYLKNN